MTSHGASDWSEEFLAPDQRFPSRPFETDRTGYELCEADEQFDLRVEMPGFAPDEMTSRGDDGVRNVAADHEDEARGQRETSHRRVRVPETVDEAIAARYADAILGAGSP